MSGLWEDIKNAYISYNGMGTKVLFLFVAIFYFLIIIKKRAEKQEKIQKMIRLVLLAKNLQI